MMSLELFERFHVPYISLAGLIILVNLYLFEIYRFEPEAGRPLRRRWSPAWLEFTALDIGGFSYWQLTLVSFAGLFWNCS